MTDFVRCIWFSWAALLCLPVAFGQNVAEQATVHFSFKEPHRTGYRVTRPVPGALGIKDAASSQFLKARPDHGTTAVEFGNRIVLELVSADDLDDLLDGRPLKLSRAVAGRAVFILDAPDAWTALTQAASLAEQPGVIASYPVARRAKQLHNSYAPRPNDPYFFRPNQPNTEWQPYLENRDTNGMPLGVDLNVRAAWAITRGAGVTLAIGDDGVELNHPDLAEAAVGAPHMNFYGRDTNGMPLGILANHGTAVAGLALARAGNGIGIAGVAPEARLASWVLFNERDDLGLTEDVLMDVFQYQSNVVAVQNHSWGKQGREQLRLSLLEDIGVSNAVTFGRGGRGVVIVRAGGNGRLETHNANDDGYTADPRVITVGAIRLDGRVARYSAPGACILVAAPSGDSDEELSPCGGSSPNLMTTDRQGANGYNSNSYTNDLANYGFDRSGFSGTSASTPQIAGVAALLLSANTNLTYRDVQHLLVQSSRHFDLADSALQTNGAGFRVSHNVGYGVPDAGLAVALARNWVNRPPATKVVYAATNAIAIPDQGCRLILTGPDVPESLRSIPALPGLGPIPDTATPLAPLIHVGQTIDGIQTNLNGAAALIQRGGNFFCEKLANAATAGALFAVVYNNRDLDERIIMGASDTVAIPSVFLSQRDGEAVRDFLATHPETKAQLRFESNQHTFAVSESLICEHVLVRVDAEHSRRGDLRIVLVSPHGTRSVLQNINHDDAPGPLNWTYYSTQHFYEGTAGEWKLIVSDLDSKGVGRIRSVTLTLFGVPIADADRDGLDDNWERRYFTNLERGPLDDPDRDGYSNAREQSLHRDPTAPDGPFELNLSLWDARLARLSWPSSTNTVYQLSTGREAATLLTLVTNVPGRFPNTEVFVPYTNLGHQFFRVQALPDAPATR